MIEEIKTYYCKRTRNCVYGEKLENISGRIIVHCKFYTDYNIQARKLPCFLNESKKRKCLVRLAVQKDNKIKI